MNILQDIFNDKELEHKLSVFIKKYGLSGLVQALDSYEKAQQEYIFKTKTSISKVQISDINYIEIRGHHIVMHTSYGTFQKYGTLNQELRFLSPHGFIRCSQSCIVQIHKIKSIYHNTLLLKDGTTLHMSRYYSTKIILEFSLQKER